MSDFNVKEAMKALNSGALKVGGARGCADSEMASNVKALMSGANKALTPGEVCQMYNIAAGTEYKSKKFCDYLWLHSDSNKKCKSAWLKHDVASNTYVLA